MKTSSWVALVALLFVQTSGGFTLPEIDWRGLVNGLTDTTKVDPDVPPPSASLQELVAPIGAKLAGDRAKAVKVASAFTGYADAMESPIGETVQTTGQWGQVIAAATSRLDVAGGVSVAAELRAAVKSHVGIATDPDAPDRDVDRSLSDSDRQKIVEIYRAIAWAAANPRAD